MFQHVQSHNEIGDQRVRHLIDRGHHARKFEAPDAGFNAGAMPTAIYEAVIKESLANAEFKIAARWIRCFKLAVSHNRFCVGEAGWSFGGPVDPNHRCRAARVKMGQERLGRKRIDPAVGAMSAHSKVEPIGFVRMNLPGREVNPRRSVTNRALRSGREAFARKSLKEVNERCCHGETWDGG